MERCAGERGKGFFWSVDPRFEHTVKDQEGKTHSTSEKQKAKNLKLLEPPLKRSVKGDSLSPLPPPLLPPSQLISAQPASAIVPGPTTSSAAPVQQTKFIIETPQRKLEQELGNGTPNLTSLSHAKMEDTLRQESHVATSAAPSSPAPGSNLPSLPSDVIPIVIGPVSPSEPADGEPSKAASILGLSSAPIAFQNNTIVLNPTIFSSLTPVHLKELESLGAKKAIEILQTYIVRFLKEKRKAETSKAKGKKKKDKSKKKDGNSTKELSVATANGTPDNIDSTSGAPEPAPVDASSSTTLLSPMSGMVQAVEPLRISSPPVTSLLGEGDSNEEIDILGDSDEPAPKKRKVEDELQL